MALGPSINYYKVNNQGMPTIAEGILEAKRYTGISFYPRGCGYVVSFRHKGGREYFGPYKTAAEAGQMYDQLHAEVGNIKAPSDKWAGQCPPIFDEAEEFDFDASTDTQEEEEGY